MMFGAYPGPWINVLLYDAYQNPISSTPTIGGSALNVAIVAGGGSGGTSIADESLFSAGETLGTPAMGADTTANEAVILEVYPGSRTLQTLLMALSAGTPAAVAFGQALMAASLPVTIASNQSAIPVTGSISVAPTTSATGANPAQTTVNAASNAKLRVASATSTGFCMQNIGNTELYVLLQTGGTASSTNYTKALSPGETWYGIPGQIWTGEIYCNSSANGGSVNFQNTTP